MKSMTGFGTSELNQNGLNIKVTAKSLNDKYLSVKCKTPKEFPELISYQIEKLVPRLIRRGSIYITILAVDNCQRPPDFVLNNNVIEKYVQLLQEIVNKYNLKQNIGISDILQLENIFSSPTTNDYTSANFQETLLNLVEKAIEQLLETRIKEGDNLEEFFIKSINKMEVSLSTVELSVPNFLEELKVKIQNRLKGLEKIDFQKSNDEKLLSLLSYFTDKSDITEEIVRLKSHIKKLGELISIKDTPIGLSLGFVIQEMQREIGTISAKYNYIPMFPEILKIREELEKCKEQALNVE